TASVRDLLAERPLAERPPDPTKPADPAEAGGDFAAEAYRLGHAVAIVHTDLATALGGSPAPARYLQALVAGMHGRRDAGLAPVPALAPHAEAVRGAFDEIRELDPPVPLQRVHGDLHLGQVLRNVTGWVLIDFEGEPLVPLAGRVAPASP